MFLFFVFVPHNHLDVNRHKIKYWLIDFVTLSLTINGTLKQLSSLPILMQESFRWWRCSVKYSPPLPPPPGISVPRECLFGDNPALNTFSYQPTNQPAHENFWGTLRKIDALLRRVCEHPFLLQFNCLPVLCSPCGDVALSAGARCRRLWINIKRMTTTHAHTHTRTWTIFSKFSQTIMRKLGDYERYTSTRNGDVRNHQESIWDPEVRRCKERCKDWVGRGPESTRDPNTNAAVMKLLTSGALGSCARWTEIHGLPLLFFTLSVVKILACSLSLQPFRTNGSLHRTIGR